LKIKRILREIANYQKNPHPAIEIYPCENRLTFWRLLLVGPKGTPYENGMYTIHTIHGYSLLLVSFHIGVFVLYAKFPDDYPSSPPEIRFVTPVGLFDVVIYFIGIMCDCDIDLSLQREQYRSNLSQCI
jgi:ubiquitin-conjugating enzyme E2 D/E